MNKFIILPVILLSLLMSTYFLPGQGELQPSAISMELPKRLGGWRGSPLKPSLEEKKTLSKDTVFSKMDYWRLGNPKDHYAFVPNNVRVHLSVVFSGHDVNNSIHRPERCLPAQGHYNMVSQNALVRVDSLGIDVPVKRLNSKQKINLRSRTKGEEQSEFELDSLTYYFFVGHSALSDGHVDRTILDVKDRLLRGYDQRWAFVLMSIPFGEHPYPNMSYLTEEEADQILKRMIADLAKESIDWKRIQRGVIPLEIEVE